MKVIRVKSSKYQLQTVVFGKFKMAFNKNNIAEVIVEDDNEEAELEKVVNNYSYCIHLLDKETDLMLEEQNKNNIELLKKQIASLETENKALKAANEDLSIKNVQLASENKAYKEALKNAKTATTVNVGNTQTQQVAKNEEVDEESKAIKTALQKKTVEELKTMLKDMAAENSAIKEEEYAGLNKSQLVEYIMNKMK